MLKIVWLKTGMGRPPWPDALWRKEDFYVLIFKIKIVYTHDTHTHFLLRVCVCVSYIFGHIDVDPCVGMWRIHGACTTFKFPGRPARDRTDL